LQLNCCYISAGGKGVKQRGPGLCGSKREHAEGKKAASSLKDTHWASDELSRSVMPSLCLDLASTKLPRSAQHEHVPKAQPCLSRRLPSGSGETLRALGAAWFTLVNFSSLALRNLRLGSTRGTWTSDLTQNWKHKS